MRASTLGFVVAGATIVVATAAILVVRQKDHVTATPVPTIAPLPLPIEPPPPPRHDVLVVTEPADTFVSVNGKTIGLAPVTVDAYTPARLVVERGGYVTFETTLDRKSPKRFVVTLEKESQAKRTPAPRTNCEEVPFAEDCQRKQRDKRLLTRPPSCPPEYWDPFDGRCSAYQPTAL